MFQITVPSDTGLLKWRPSYKWATTPCLVIPWQPFCISSQCRKRRLSACGEERVVAISAETERVRRRERGSCSSGVKREREGERGTAKKWRAGGRRRFSFSNLIWAGSRAGRDKRRKEHCPSQIQEKDDYSRAWYRVCRPAVLANHTVGTLGQTAVWLGCANPTTTTTATTSPTRRSALFPPLLITTSLATFNPCRSTRLDKMINPLFLACFFSELH